MSRGMRSGGTTSNAWTIAYRPPTPRRLIATTNRPLTAPPRSAIWSARLTLERARPTATARATALSPRTRGISIVGFGSLEPAARGLVPDSSRDSHADRYDARHVLPVPRVGRVEPKRHHALLELPAVVRVRDRRIPLHPRDAPVGAHPESHPVGAAEHGPGNVAQRRHNRRPQRGGENVTAFVARSRPCRPAGS